MSDYLFMLESRLDAGQLRATGAIQRPATEAGMNVWLTGGAMRDMLRGTPSAISILRWNATPYDWQISRRDAGRRSYFRGRVETRRGTDASGRGPGVGEQPSFREMPETRRQTPHRRSHHSRRPQTGRFHHHAIGLSLNRGSRGLLVDPLNGQADLANRELRTTNPPCFSTIRRASSV
jgi:tRNA nucleotidyltransferase (CCA-adding enzyme)